MATLTLDPPGTVHRPRNVDWKRAAALLYGDWGTSKAYVLGLAFLAAGFSSLPIILAVCALTGLVGNQLRHDLQIFSRWRRRLFGSALARPAPRGRRCAASGGGFDGYRSAQRLVGAELLQHSSSLKSTSFSRLLACFSSWGLSIFSDRSTAAVSP